MQNRRLTLVLDADVYRKLADQAKSEERDPVQQARVIIRRALELSERPREVAAS